MPSYELSIAPRMPSAYEDECYQEAMQEFTELQLMRFGFAGQWEEIASLIWPSRRNTFFYGNYNWPGQKKTDKQVDATGAVALSRFAAICDSLLTPRNMTWHGLTTNDPVLKRDRSVRLWYEQATRALFAQRYAPHANFQGQNYANYRSLGAFGTCAMFIDAYESPVGFVPGLRYKSIPIGQLFLRENHQGLIDGFVRWWRMTARQCYQKWGPDRFPEQLRTALEKNSETPFNFIHRVCLRTDYDPQRLDHRGKPWASYYFSIEGRAMMQEGGYNTFPLAVGRYVQEPDEVYGRSPAMEVLPALKTLNMEKSVFLKQGHRAGDPILLTTDDGLVDGFSFRPGSLNPGGMSEEGRPLVGVLPTGNHQLTLEMMQLEEGIVNDVFLVRLMSILEEKNSMTATEVVERINEKGILLAPTVGRQQSEYLGPTVDRELDLLSQLRILPPMPQALREARGQYETVYTSPLSRAMRAQEAAGFMRTLETGLSIVNATQDPSALDRLDVDAAMQGTGEIQSVPESWMRSDAAVAMIRKNRARAMAQQQKIQAMPAEAAMMKARAATAKLPPAGIAQPIPFPGQ